jgi:hypothetical protein
MAFKANVLARLALTLLACGIGTAQAQDCSNEASLKSATQGDAVELSFRNASNESRRLYWLDPKGNRRFVSLIRPGSIYSQPTAATHSWVVTDETEKCLFAVTATSQPQTIEVGTATAAQIAPPNAGTQQPIVAAPAPVAEAAPVAAPLASVPPAPDAARSVPDVALNAVSDAASDAAQEDVPVQVPQVSPIEQFSLTGNLRVLAVAEEGKSLNNQASGTVEVARVNPEWDSGQWSFEPVADTPFVRIKNNWKRTYLTDVNSQLKAISAPADADPSHWSIEPVDGTSYVQLRNRETDRFLLNANGAPSLVNDFRQDQEKQSYWQVNPATDSVGVTAPRMAAVSAYNSALSDCRDIGGVWTGSSCRSNYAAMGYGVTQPLACPRGWFWDQEAGECLYEVASGGPACPPWQIGPGGQCVSNLTCRGGSLRISRRGASCDCPFGMTPWGNYPNLSCKPSVARIVPLLLLSKLGGSLNTKHGGPRFALGQAYGNKQFGKGLQTNTSNGGNVIIKISKPGSAPTSAGTTAKPVIVVSPVVINPTGIKPTGSNAGVNNPVGILTNPVNPVIGGTKTDAGTTTANPNAGLEKAVSDFNKLTPQQKTQAISACKNDSGPGCAAIKQSVGLPTGNAATTTNPGKPDALQSACQANPNLPACKTPTTTNANAGRVTPTGTNPNVDPTKVVPVNNQTNQADANAKLKADADAKAKADAANKLKIEADNKAKIDAANKVKIEADNKAKADAANKLKIEADNKAKIDAANRAKIDAANKAKIDAANQAKINAANQAKINAANQARVNAARPTTRPQTSGCPAGRRMLPNGACA